MAQQLNLKIAGLYTNPNQLSTVPDGALVQAKNIRLNTDNLAESRRGLDRLTGAFTLSGDRAHKYFIYQEKLLAQYGTDKLAYYSTNMWNVYTGSYNPPEAGLFKTKAAAANSNFYFTSTDGVYKLDAYNSTPAISGVPQGLDVNGVLTAPAAGTWFADDNAVAYRVIWAIKDANNNVSRSAPSQRFTIANTSGSTKAVDITFTVPDGITTSHFFEVYRSAQSGGAAIEPSEELQLVYSAKYTSGDTVTISDITDDTLRGAALYTNPSQEGILQSNYRPPFCKDIEVFRNITFYANTKLPHQFQVTLLAVGPADGLQAGDVITLDGVDYTGAAAENIGANEFKVFSTGSPAQNIADTAQSLIRVVNRTASNNTIYGYYLSSVNELPGKMLFKKRLPGAASFTTEVDAHGSAFNPNLSTAQASTQSIDKNALYFSKSDQPEAVPLVNVLFIGAASAQILRIIALRDSLFILKEDGLYRVSGTDSTSLSAQLFDPNTRLLAPETARTLSNFIFALTDQGVVKISDTGVSVISRPIEDQLLQIFGFNLATVKTDSFAVSYETDRTYHLWTLNAGGGTQPGRCFVYNVFTNSWTEDELIKTAGIVGTFEMDGGTLANNRLVLGEAASNRTNIERKSFNNTDFVDDSFSVTVVSSSGQDVVLSSTTGIVVGDLLFESSSKNAVITDITGNTVTVNLIYSWTPGARLVYKGIPITIQWVPLLAGNPGKMKHWREGSLLFKERRFVLAQLAFRSDIVNQPTSIDVSGVFGYGWGLFPWGGVPWGGQAPLPLPIRFYVPALQQRCSQLTVLYTQRSAYSLLKFEGISLIYRDMIEKVQR